MKYIRKTLLFDKCSVNQCCAPNTSNARCTNDVTQGINHCEIHRLTATKLYLRYKKLSDKIDNLNINKMFPKHQDHIDHVMRCYVLLNKTFSARTKHRKYAFVPECYDEGHDYQFIKLRELIDKCENILSELYSSSPSDTIESSSEESIDQVIDFEPEVRKRVKNYRKYRRDIEKDIEHWINKYVEENRVILERRELLIGHIVKFIYEIFDPYDEDDYLYPKCVMMFHLSLKLHSIGYLSKDSTGKKMKAFVPPKCENRNCDGYEATDLVLGCSCIYEANTIMKDLNLSSEDTLNQFYGTLLNNKDKIIPILPDIKHLYSLYKDQLMFMKLYIVWDPSKNRLVIERNMNNRSRNPSQILAASRLKTKAYQARYG